MIDRPRVKSKIFRIDKKQVRKIFDETLERGETAIVGESALEILRQYGIPSAISKIAWSEKETIAAADELGYPVVVKINTPAILHKTEMNAVKVDLRTPQEVKKAFIELRKNIMVASKTDKKEKFSVFVQEMVSGGIETVIGMTTDRAFGPLIMFGLGGIYVEILKDVSFRIHPLNNNNVDEMISGLKSYPLLTGFRGAEPVDLPALKESLLRLSQLVTDFDIIDEIDINPFIACSKKGRSRAVDARFIIRESKTEGM